jgi:TusA-related sulfurtransferase
MGIIPQEFEWVMARATCTIEKMFEQFHQGVVDDVVAINSLRKFPEEKGFKVEQSGREYSFIIKRAEAIRPFVKFSIAVGDCINVSTDADKNGRDYRITLNDEGRCKLTENGEEHEQWQVRRASLESLFFPSDKYF